MTQEFAKAAFHHPLAIVLAALLASSCDQPARPVEPQRDDGAAQIAAERAAEDKVMQDATLARLSREVAELHVEIDQLKASRRSLDQKVIDQRLQVLESKAVEPPLAAAPVPEAIPTPAVAAKPAPKPTLKPSRPKPQASHPAPKATADPVPSNRKDAGGR